MTEMERSEVTSSTAELVTLVDMAAHLVERAPQQAWQCVERARYLVNVLNASDAQAQVARVAGVCLTTLGRFEDAKQSLIAAATTFTIYHQPLQVACCTRDIAVADYFLGNYPAAKAGMWAALTTIPCEQPLERGRCLRWMAVMANFLQKPQEAETYISEAEALLEPLDLANESAACIFVRGLLAFQYSAYALAFQLFTDAATRFETLGEEISLGRVWCEMGYTLRNQEKIDKAVVVAKQALRLFQRHGLTHRIGMANELLGTIALLQNRFKEAYTYIEVAYRAYQATRMQAWAVETIIVRANLDYYLGTWSVSEAGYQQALYDARTLGLSYLVFLTEANMGMLACNQGRFDEALVRLQNALEKAQALGRVGDMGHCHRQLARCYMGLHQSRQVHQHYMAMVELLQRMDMKLTLARAQAEYAQWCLETGEYRQAGELLDAARAVLVAYNAPVFIVDCDRQRAEVALKQGDWEQAQELIEPCRKVYVEEGLPLALARLQRIEGAVLQQRGQRAAAEVYQRAYAVLAGPLPLEAALIAVELATLTRAEHDALGALGWLRRAVQLMQQARNRVPTEQLAGQLAQQFAPTLLTALHLAYELQTPAEALAMAEDARAQVTRAWLDGQRRAQPSDPQTQQLAGRCYTLRKAIEQAQQAALATIPEQPVTPTISHPPLVQLYEEYDQALALWRRFGSGVVPGGVTPFDWEACRMELAQLPVGWQALVYWLQDDWLIGWHCTPSGIESWRHHLQPADQFALELCCDPAPYPRQRVYDHDPQTWYTSGPAQHLARVAALVLPPRFRPTHPVDLLIIVPAGQLHTLPFAALPWQGRPLMMAATLLTVPSLHLLAQLLQRSPSQAEQVLAVGISQHRNRPQLSEAGKEARMVAAAHDQAEVWCDDDATPDRLRQASAAGDLLRFRLLHFATHAWSDARYGTQAGIALADGDVLLVDIAQLHLDADVLVLAACESGVATRYEGEEQVGLALGALQAGARALVVSLWVVGDERSLQLMEWFYALRQEGREGPWSLVTMQRAAWERGISAFGWAAYTWLGTPRG
ncbi:MAG: CHAT domain-containing protein [Herpetosiphonaceae bacterium]|nr:CHAT domain-containing protein [Herpetosiphonaceae bacterium]